MQQSCVRLHDTFSKFLLTPEHRFSLQPHHGCPRVAAAMASALLTRHRAGKPISSILQLLATLQQPSSSQLELQSSFAMACVDHIGSATLLQILQLALTTMDWERNKIQAFTERLIAHCGLHHLLHQTLAFMPPAASLSSTHFMLPSENQLTIARPPVPPHVALDTSED